MSGYEAVTDWIFDNYDVAGTDDFDDLISEVSLDFESNNRLPLDEIFDYHDFERLYDEWQYNRQVMN